MKKGQLLLITVIFTFLTLQSCSELMKVVDKNKPLTEAEVVKGLKEALKIGTEAASTNLSKTDGYFKDNLIKILLPPEADVVIKNIEKIPGGDKLVQDLIMSINRSAEDAAKEVAPIFASAITGMTIQDGFTILRGNNDAATQYLKKSTYSKLVNLYKPKINKSLDKKLVAGISANQSWDALTTQWNKFAGSAVGQIAGFEKVETKLDTYLTEKALDGLFLKLAKEEEKIRTNPGARVTELLKRVFGS
jgi:hypothetical protein